MVEFKMYYGGRWVRIEPGEAARYTWVCRSGAGFRLVRSGAVRRGLVALREGARGCLRRGDPLPLPAPAPVQRSPAQASLCEHRHHSHCAPYKRYSDGRRPPAPPRPHRDASVQTDTQTRCPLRPNNNNKQLTNNVTNNKQASNNVTSNKLISSDRSTDADIPLKLITLNNTKLTSPKIRRQIISNDADTSDENIPSRRITLDASRKMRRKMTTDRYSLYNNENIPSRRIACSTATKLEKKLSPKRRRIICNDTDTSTDENITLKRTVQNGTTDKRPLTDVNLSPKKNMTVQVLSSESDNNTNARKNLSDVELSQVIFERKGPQTNVSKEKFKELIIDEGDVLIIRNFIEKNCPSLDLYQFDCNDEFKQEIFYKINPVVKLEQCRRIEKMIRERQRRLFAEQLGLRSVCSSDGEDKRPRKLRRNNKDGASERLHSDKDSITERKRKDKDGDSNRVEKKQKKTSERVQSDRDSTAERTKRKEKDGDSERTKQKKPRPLVVFKRSSVRAGREYSALEDHSIVAWVSTDPRRERAVNGNRMWRLLQDQYTAITGQRRTWHSLRNRYLRYILPSLGHLALPAGQAARLRAAAATGELKARACASSRRASILRTLPVRSAAAASRRPHPHPHPHPRAECSPPPPPAPAPAPRTLRSSGARPPSPPSSPAPAPAQAQAQARSRHSPRYSEVTRRFALRHASTPTDTDTGNAKHDKAAAPTAGSAPRSRRLYNPVAP